MSGPEGKQLKQELSKYIILDSKTASLQPTDVPFVKDAVESVEEFVVGKGNCSVLIGSGTWKGMEVEGDEEVVFHSSSASIRS